MNEAGGTDYTVYLGMRDWRHPDWVGPFYPPDMPEDWQLAYYAGQFSCVWLEEAVEGAVPDAWREEVPAGFRFLTAAAPPEPGRVLWFDKDADLREITARVNAAVQDPPLYLISRDNDLAGVERVRTLLGLLGL